MDLEESTYASGLHQAPHRHEFASVTLLVRGTLDETVGGHREGASALSVVVKPPGVPHETRFGPMETSTLRLAIAPRALETSPTVRAALQDWRWVHGGPAAAALLGLLNARRHGRLTRAVLGRGVSSVIRSLAGERRNPGSLPPLWLSETRESIERDPGAARTAALSRRVHVHPVYLARTFRRHYGCSVGALIRRRRVIAAARLIADGDAPLVDVAYEAGFSDQAHFCREFRSVTGATPLQFRRLAQAG